MATNSAKECAICNEEFDEEFRCPRILPCAHCICSDCINQLIGKNAKECPFCRQTFEGTSARDFGRNNNILDLLQYIATLEGKCKSPPKSPIAPPRAARTYEDFIHENIQNCRRAEEHIKDVLRKNVELKTGLLMDNQKIKSEILEKINVMLAENDRQVEDLDKENKRLQKQWHEVRKVRHQVTNPGTAVDPAYDPDRTGSLTNNVQDPLLNLQSWLKNFQGFISRCEDMHEQIAKTVHKNRRKIGVIQETLNSAEGPEEVEESLLPDLKGLTLTDDTSKLISAESLREMSGSVMQMVTNGMLFAVQLHQGKRRSARIFFTESNNLCVTHLTEEELPSKANVVKHSDLLRLLDPSSRLTFLELGVNGSTLGKLYIRLAPETKLGDHFAYLCTGEMGPSYAKTNILEVIEKGHERKEFVQFGDYEKNDSTGGKALISGLSSEFGEQYKRPWVAGTVGGWWWGWRGDQVAGQFIINTKKNRKQECEPVFGMVEGGLQILTKAISQYTHSQIQIYNCGVVLPTPNFSESAPPTFQGPKDNVYYGFVL